MRISRQSVGESRFRRRNEQNDSYPHYPHPLLLPTKNTQRNEDRTNARTRIVLNESLNRLSTCVSSNTERASPLAARVSQACHAVATNWVQGSHDGMDRSNTDEALARTGDAVFSASDAIRRASGGNRTQRRPDGGGPERQQGIVRYLYSNAKHCRPRLFRLNGGRDDGDFLVMASTGVFECVVVAHSSV